PTACLRSRRGAASGGRDARSPRSPGRRVAPAPRRRSAPGAGRGAGARRSGRAAGRGRRGWTRAGACRVAARGRLPGPDRRRERRERGGGPLSAAAVTVPWADPRPAPLRRGYRFELVKLLAQWPIRLVLLACWLGPALLVGVISRQSS